jgi:hypothetical protein
MFRDGFLFNSKHCTRNKNGLQRPAGNAGKKTFKFQRVRFATTKLICFCQNGEDKIVLPESILPRVVEYYYEAMAHVEGMSRQEQTLKCHYYHPTLSDEIKRQLEIALNACAASEVARCMVRPHLGTHLSRGSKYTVIQWVENSAESARNLI